MFEFELPEKFRRYVPLLAWLIVALVILAIPLKIIALGYLPADDALRHVAKAVSGKSWPEILVLGDTFKIDQSLGWHAILGFIHHLTGWDTEGLIVFSVVAMFLIVNSAMLPWLKRPEAWLAMLLGAIVITDVPQRFMLGRPFALTIMVLMTVLFAVQHNKPCWRMFVMVTGLMTACTYIHGVWYLWLLPVAAFFFAGQFRWTALLAGGWLLGTAFSMLLSGHPTDYLNHAVAMALHGVGGHLTNRTEVTELRPFGGDILAVIMLGGVVALRLFLKPAALPFTRNPAFWMVCGCWILGFRIGRFWEDWGWPSLMVLIATEVEFLLVAKMAADSLRRLLLVMILGLATFMAMTSDPGSRWTGTLTWQFLSAKEHPEIADWLPEKGGILYSADMSVFYQTFYKNPHGDWRYQLGYEPALMPAEDFETYHKIMWNSGDVKAYAPWVEKMKPADRLVIPGNSVQRPNIPVLEWNFAVSGLWVGRLPRATP
ncbi:MAG TPA: hypothetical protein VK815_08585 [Candidatus Acidoferrales bacterium]|jgi:hypothetical protein|nr:hypothetical protein [Candidatus Acidoferrales bacterium]